MAGETARQDPILDAIGAGDLEEVRAILRQRPGAAAARDPRGVTALRQALYRRREDLAAEILAAGPPLDLFDAAARGEIPRLRELLDAAPGGVDERAGDGFTALHLAAFFGRVDALRFLLERGADADAEASNPSRVRPLHSAAACRSVETVRALVRHGCDVNAKQEGGFTALHAAALHGLREMAEILLEAGADRSVVDDQGRTAEAFAREAGHSDLVARLA